MTLIKDSTEKIKRSMSRTTADHLGELGWIMGHSLSCLQGLAGCLSVGRGCVWDRAILLARRGDSVGLGSCHNSLRAIWFCPFISVRFYVVILLFQILLNNKLLVIIVIINLLVHPRFHLSAQTHLHIEAFLSRLLEVYPTHLRRTEIVTVMSLIAAEGYPVELVICK